MCTRTYKETRILFKMSFLYFNGSFRILLLHFLRYFKEYFSFVCFLALLLLYCIFFFVLFIFTFLFYFLFFCCIWKIYDSFIFSFRCLYRQTSSWFERRIHVSPLNFDSIYIIPTRQIKEDFLLSHWTNRIIYCVSFIYRNIYVLRNLLCFLLYASRLNKNNNDT